MKTDAISRYFNYLVCGSLLSVGLLLPARAQTVTYNFDSPQFTLNETTPLLNRAPNIGLATFSADFVASPTAGGFVISTFAPNILFSGQMLYIPNTPPNLLTISLNTPVYGVTLAFATITNGVLDFLSPAGSVSQNSAVVGGSFEGGTLTFNSGTPFTSFQLNAFDQSNAQILFAVDNMSLTLTAVPEPTAGGLLVFGASAFVFARRFRK